MLLSWEIVMKLRPFSLLKALGINLVVLEPYRKVGWLRESTNTFLRPLRLFYFNLGNIEENVFKLLHIL